jgi:hypothetical protein
MLPIASMNIGWPSARPCCLRGLSFRLVAAVSTRALISGDLSQHPGA